MKKSTVLVLAATAAAAAAAAAGAGILSGKSIKDLVKGAPETTGTDSSASVAPAYTAPAAAPAQPEPETPVSPASASTGLPYDAAPVLNNEPQFATQEPVVPEEKAEEKLPDIPEPIPEPEHEPDVKPEEPQQENHSYGMGLPYLAGKMDREDEAGVVGGAGFGMPEVVSSTVPIQPEDNSSENEPSGDDALPPIMKADEPSSEQSEIGDSLPSFDEKVKTEFHPVTSPEINESVAEKEVKLDGGYTQESESKPHKKLTDKIGDNTVSVDPADPLISKVSSEYGVPEERLVSIKSDAGMGLVFEFIDPFIKNDSTLMNVYSHTPDGKMVLPDAKEAQQVIDFGKKFITDHEALAEFIK